MNDRRISSIERLGTQVNTRTSEQAIIDAGLNVEYEKTQLISPYDGTPLEGTFGVFRADTKDFISPVGNIYEIIQAKKMFNWMDIFLGADANYINAGYFDNGKKIFIQAQPKTISIVGDEYQRSLTGISSFDGSIACQLKSLLIRITCYNSFIAGIRAKGTRAKTKHTSNAIARMDDKIYSLKDIENINTTIEEKLKFLADRQVNGNTVVDIMKKLFPDYLNEEKEKRSTRVENRIKSILEYFESNDNNENQSVRGTAYNLFNAIIEHTDYASTVRRTASKIDYTEEQLRAEASLFGTGADFKEKAFEVIMEVAPNMAYKPWHQRITTFVPETNIFDRVPEIPETNLLDEVINNTIN